MNIIVTLLKYLDVIGPLLGLLLSIYFLRKTKKAGDHYIIIGYLSLQLIANSIAKYMMLVKVNNIHVYQANAFISLLVVSLWFLQIFKLILPAKQYRLIRIYMSVSILILLLIISIENTGGLNSISLMFSSFSIILYTAIFYIISLRNLNEENILKTIRFWIVSVFFFYYVSCFMIFWSFKLLSHMAVKNAFSLWSLHNFLLFVACCILAFACKKLAHRKNDAGQ